jgi:hypothetical protein
VRYGVLTWVIFAALLAVAACAPPISVDLEVTPETPTAAATPSPTETIVWFPPTPTRTLPPTVEVLPTPDLRPIRGPELLVDDFSDAGHWQVSQTADGSIAYGRSELTLAVREPRVALISFRNGPQLDDFFLEITTRANLCRGADAYGLLLRAASADDYYRFLINCNGELRLERIMDGRSLPVQDWVPSGMIPAGSPVELHIAVLASGRQLSFFINDIHQFDISDPVLPSGTVGLYARSAGDTALTVSFSDLLVTALTPEMGGAAVQVSPTAEEAGCPLNIYTGRPRCEDN